MSWAQFYKQTNFNLINPRLVLVRHTVVPGEGCGVWSRLKEPVKIKLMKLTIQPEKTCKGFNV